jgi:hypothetical protein
MIVTRCPVTLSNSSKIKTHQGSSLFPEDFLISRRLSIGKAPEWLAPFWEASEAEEHRNQIIDIP